MINKMIELRRYVAIVPYQTRGVDGSLVLVNGLFNTLVLIVWVFGAAIFTAFRFRIMKFAILRDLVEPISKLDLYFRCLAMVVGNTSGGAKSILKADSF